MTRAAHGSHAPGAGEPWTRALGRMNRFQEPEARQAIANLRLPRGSRGLDVGAGVGLFTLWLAQAVGPRGRVVGVEPSAERVATARALVGRSLPARRLSFVPADGTALPWPDRAFDWLWCGDVLHHIPDTQAALREFRRVVRPGGRIVVKEGQVPAAQFLPGHPELERRLQRAEAEWSRAEAGGRTFQERRQTTLAALREARLADVELRTYVVQRRTPLPATARGYIQRVVFARNWGPRIRPLLTRAEWRERCRRCEPASPGYVLRSRGYYCLYPFTVFSGRVPAR